MSFFNAASTGTMAAGDVINTIFDTLDKAKNAARHAQTSSLVNITSVARVEPLAIMDSDSFNSDFIGPVMQCAHNIFTAYYLQAISLLGDVGKINVIKTLDRLNPNRKPEESGFIRHLVTTMVTESYQDKIFGFGNEDFKLPNYAMEAKEEKEDKVNSSNVRISEKAYSTVNELSNLSIGKLIEVTIRDQDVTATIPLAIRLIANELPQAPMLRLLSLQGMDRTFTERYYKWRAGRISFIKDLVLMQDLVREDKKAMMQDKSGVLDEIMRRAKNNKLAGFFSKNASLNEAANIVIFSEETAKQLKLNHNIDVDNFKQRQTIFDGSYAMILVKIDREWERITFYINGQPLGSSMNKNELKSNAGKGSGTDLVEVLQALNKANQTSLF